MTNLNQKIQKLMIQAMKDHDATKLAVIRFLRSQIKNREIDKKTPLDDKEVINLIRNLIKKQKEEIEFLKQAGRQNQIDQEGLKLSFLESLLPPEMGLAEIEAEIRKAVDKDQLTKQNFGRLMARFVKHFEGRVSGDKLAAVLRKLTN